MDGDRPKRLIARAMTDFLVTSAQAWARPHGGDLTQAFVFCTVFTANMEPLALDDPLAVLAVTGEDEDRAPRRPISVHAVATSLSLSYETVRRRIVAMAAAGTVARVPGGVVVRASALRTDAMRAAMAEVRALLGDALAILESIGLDLTAYAAGGAGPAGGPPPSPSDAVVAHIVMGAQIRMLERIGAIFGDVVGAYLFGGVLRANQAELLVDADMAWRYATQAAMTPDEFRRPVSIATLSRQLGLPLETVRRQVGAGVRAGHLVATAQGVIVPTIVIASEADLYQTGKMSLEFFRMLAGLAQVGLFSSPRA